MLENKIKEIFNLSEISPEINDKINNIEANGYTFSGVSKETMKTKDSTVGSYGFFDPLMFYEMRGKEYKIATFENESGQKRYCILNDQNELVNKSYSKLKWERTEGLSQDEVELTKAITQELKNIGIELQEHETFQLFGNLENIDISSPDAAKQIVNNLIEDVSNAINQLQDYQVNNSVERIWSQNQNGLIVADELYCGMDRSQQAMNFISPIFRVGQNSDEQRYIVNLAVEKVFPEIASQLIDKGQVLNAEQASTFGVKQKAFDALVDKIKENPEESKDLLKQYLTYTQTSCKYPARNSNVHSKVINVIDKFIKTSPDKLNPERINGDLQAMSRRLQKSLTNYTPLAPEKINELMNKILTEFVTGDPEHGKSYRQTMDMVTVYTNPLNMENLSEFYDNMNKYLEGKDKLPKQLLKKIVELKINNLSKQLDDILNDDSLSDKEKLIKAKQVKEDFEEHQISAKTMDSEERNSKIAEIFGENSPENIDGISNKDFIEQYTISINGSDVSFDIPQFKKLTDLQIKLNEEIHKDCSLDELIMNNTKTSSTIASDAPIQEMDEEQI